MRVTGRWWVATATALLVLVSGCSGLGPAAGERSASAAATVAVPTCTRPPCGGGPGSIRWSRALPARPWIVSADGDYRITQSPQPTKGSDDEVMPAMFGSGTASTFVLSLADTVLAVDARTGATTWSLPASRLPAHSVITGVSAVDGVVSLEVTQELPTTAWRYRAVLVDVASGRIQADIAGYQAGVVMATTTRAVLENNDLLQGVDRSTGRIVWTHRIDQAQLAEVLEFDGRLMVSLPPKKGQPRSLVVLDTRDGTTVETMTAPHDIYTVLSRGTVLYFAGPGRAYAYDTVTRKTLWRVARPVHDDLSLDIDPSDGAAYVRASLPTSPYTTTSARVELSGRQTGLTQISCELRAATTVQCSTVPSPTSRARGGPAGGPTTWQSPPIPFFAQLTVEGYSAGTPAGPGPTYVAGLSCPTSQVASPPSSSFSTQITAVPYGGPARPVCARPYLVAVNRT